MLIPSYVLMEKLLSQAADHAVAGPFSGCLDGVYVGLSIAPTTGLSPSSVLSAITEANYDGYARQPLVWHPSYIETGGNVGMQSSSLYFTPSDSLVVNTITGMFIADALNAGNLLASEQWNTPQALSGPANAFSLIVLIQLMMAQGLGSSIVTN